MAGKRKDWSRPVRLLGLALIASFAMSAFAAAGASALSISPAGSALKPIGYTVSTHAITVTTESQTKRSCSGSSAGTGSFTSGTGGPLKLTLAGCTFGSASCTSAGQPTGSIATRSLTANLVYLDAAHTKFGLLLSPSGSETVAEFDCGFFGHFVWTGSLIGQITKPSLGATSAQATLILNSTSSGVQTYQQVEGTGVKHRITESRNGGAADGLALEAELTINLQQPVTFNP
jgi:hypothetical protein